MARPQVADGGDAYRYGW